MSEERKGINIKTDEIHVDDRGRVVVTNPEFKAAIEQLKQSGEKNALLGDVNCGIC